MTATRAGRSPSPSPPASISPERLAGPHAVLGLEVDEDVGAAEIGLDRVLQLMADPVRLLQRRPVHELDVQVDVAAGTRLTGAELVVADDAAVGERLDRVT